MKLTQLIKKYQVLFLITMAIFSGLLSACSSGGGSTPLPAPTSDAPQLLISQFSESNIQIGESATAVIGVANLTTSESVVVAITNNNNSVISITPSNCMLSLSAPSCDIKIIGIGAGTASFTISSTGFAAATSETITVSSRPPVVKGILFGVQDGLVFANESLISGNSPLTNIDSSQINGLASDSNGNLYAGTMGGIFNGFGAGKVFKYNTALGYWTMLAGSGAGGSLDGSSVNKIIIDRNNNLYAGTNAGNVFKYISGVWTLIGTTLINQPILALALDSNNNLYAGTNNGSDVGNVFKYVNGNWQQLGASPDGTGIQSITINPDETIYAATAGNGGNGQVYAYDGTNWNAISAFNEGAINVIAESGNNLYAGTASGKVHKYNGMGTSWSSLGIPDTSSGAQITSLMLSGSNVYAGSSNNNDDTGQVYLYDTGTSWNKIGTLNNGGVSAITIKNSTLYISTVNVGNNTGMVYQYAANMWTAVGTGALDGTPIYSTTIDSNGVYYAGTQNNVYKYLTANNFWQQLGNLPDNNGVSGLTTINDRVYVGTPSGNIYFTDNEGGSWNSIYNSSLYQVSDLLTSPTDKLYASVNYYDSNGDQILKDGRVQLYNSSTNTWTVLAGSASRQSLDGSPINSITMDSTGNLYAVTAGMGNGGLVWKYPAGGSAWVMLGLGTLDGNPITSVVTDSSLNVYAATSAVQGNQIQGGNVFKYNGLYWTQINSYSLDTLGINSLNFDSSGNLYAATAGGYMWEYSGSGGLWINTSYGIGVSINITGTSGY